MVISCLLALQCALVLASCVAGSLVYQKVALGLTEIPADIPEGATTVNLAWNNFTILRKENVTHLGNVRILNLQGNQIREIKTYTFRNLQDLEELILDNNRIGSLSEQHIWYGLSSLKVLSLRGCSISWVPFLSDGRVMHLQNLEILDLGDNSMSELPRDNSIRRHGNIVQLRLDGNRLKTPVYGCFQEMANLQLLDLSDNQMEEFPSLAVSVLDRLDILDVSKNAIKVIPENGQNRPDNLRILDVSYNNIRRIQPKVLTTFPGLEILKMNDN